MCWGVSLFLTGVHILPLVLKDQEEVCTWPLGHHQTVVSLLQRVAQSSLPICAFPVSERQLWARWGQLRHLAWKKMARGRIWAEPSKNGCFKEHLFPYAPDSQSPAETSTCLLTSSKVWANREAFLAQLWLYRPLHPQHTSIHAMPDFSGYPG